MSELRKDPILRRWVIIAPDRANRPTNVPEPEYPNAPGFDPFLEGHESKTPPEITAIREPGTRANNPGWKIRVVPNKFPVLEVERELGKRGDGMYDYMEGIGAHEVFIEAPNFVTSLTQLPEDHIADIIKLYRERLIDLKRDSRLQYGLIFKNKGRDAGATVEHAHSQLIVTPIVPRTVEAELEGSKAHFDYHERCAFCDIIRQDSDDERRIVMKTDRFVALAPYASRFPFETWILPTAHHSHFETTLSGGAEREELAHILKNVLQRLEVSLNNPAYNYMIHTAPLSAPALPHYHWHIEIIPRVVRTAGFEWGSGFYINSVAPETAAEFLRSTRIDS